MVLDGLKLLKSIEKQILFLTLGHSKKQYKNDTKGDPKSHDKWFKMEPGGAQDRFILRFYRFLEKAKKLDFPMRFQGDQKTNKNRPVERQRLEKSPPSNNEWTDWSPGGARQSRLGIKRPTTSRWSHTPMGQGPGELPFYLFAYSHVFVRISLTMS